ncbi:hypothetical protein SGRI78S_01003 [Streptomyces griseus subsp. griseus]
MGSRAKRVESPGRKARAPTASGEQTAAASIGLMPLRIATKVTRRPTALAKTNATNGPSPPGATIIRMTATTRTAAQASRNCSRPMPCPALRGSRPDPATAAFTRAPVPSAIAEARSSYTRARTQAKASRSRATTPARIPGRPCMSWSGSAVHSTKPSRASRTEPPKRPAPRMRASPQSVRSLATAVATASDTSSKTAGGSDSEKGRIDRSRRRGCGARRGYGRCRGRCRRGAPGGSRRVRRGRGSVRTAGGSRDRDRPRGCPRAGPRRHGCRARRP